MQKRRLLLMRLAQRKTLAHLALGRPAGMEGPHVGHGAAPRRCLQRVRIPLLLQQPSAGRPRRPAGEGLAHPHACSGVGQHFSSASSAVLCSGLPMHV